MNTTGIPRVAGGTVIAIALGALAGWQLDVAWLKSLAPDQAPVNPATALGLVLLGVALCLAPGRERPAPARWVVRGCAVAALALGLARLTGYLFGFDPVFDHVLFAERWRATSGFPGRMAPQTALNFVLVGVALWLLGRPTKRAQLAVQLLALASGFMALVSVTGHLYGMRVFYGASALNTALGFLLAAAGVLWSQPDRGLAALIASATPGGVLARSLIPAIIGVSLLLGWLRLAGQRAGLYDTEGGAALFVVATIAVFTTLAWWSALTLDRADAERRAADQALRESEERHRLLFERNPLPAWVFDLATLRFLAVNDAAVRAYGYSREQFLTMTIADIRPPEDVPALRETVAAVAAGRAGGGTWRHRKKDGSVIEVEITSHALTFAGRPADLVLARDITARRRAEEALRASEERFRTVATTATDAIVSADQHGDVTFFNPGAERIFGYTAEEMSGKPLTVLMPERFRDAHRAGLARYLATGEAHVVGTTVELAGRKKDGTEFPLELSLASWRRGAEVAFTAIIRDITERKHAEETLRRYAAQLEVANAELDAFAYSVSHDLRAPLRSIDGFSQALLEDCADRLDDAGRDSLGRVRAATQRMGVLIDDLLRLSRVTRSELHREPVDLSALAHDVAADLRRSAPAREVELTIATGVVAEGDPRLLRVVLENLLGNAWKYTARQAQAEVEFGVTNHSGERAFFVRDNGAGFDMAYAGKLFGPFQRLHSTAEFEGTGIGLATVQRVVRRHGGRVWAESGTGRGATFYFTL